jgi:16S rRNA (adenine1518-N6/adenine1519-N6)-dimethyltransferase
MLKKKFGQHFLSDPNILRRIVEFAGVQPEDTVIEIGPGGGALTRALAAAAKRVVAVEIDPDLIPSLRERMPANVEIVEADAIDADLGALSDGSFRLVGNLPYNVATPLFKRFIAFRRVIIDATVMIQKEVAERIIATPRDEAYGPLSVLIQYYATPQYGFTVRPGAFRPIPKVDSAVIRLDWRLGVPDAQDFTAFVHRVFGSRRKKLVNNLMHVYPERTRESLLETMQRASIPADVRPENLSVNDYLGLFAAIRRF